MMGIYSSDIDMKPRKTPKSLYKKMIVQQKTILNKNIQ